MKTFKSDGTITGNKRNNTPHVIIFYTECRRSRILHTLRVIEFRNAFIRFPVDWTALIIRCTRRCICACMWLRRATLTLMDYTHKRARTHTHSHMRIVIFTLCVYKCVLIYVLAANEQHVIKTLKKGKSFMNKTIRAVPWRWRYGSYFILFKFPAGTAPRIATACSGGGLQCVFIHSPTVNVSEQK
jgi:hypothetical protein